ncbi:MAG: hypothetical protein MR022_09830 [Ruminococcus sp.]|nr:hypothetical protein [Ruminococcus sp.]
MSKISESHKKGNRKWDAENMTTLGCKVKKEQAERFKSYAQSNGTTANALLKNFVLDTIKE